MAVVPVIDGPLVRQQPLPGTKLVAPEGGGVLAGVAHGLEQLGAGVGDYASAMFDVKRDQAQLEARTADNNYSRAISDSLYGEHGFTTLRQGAALGSFETTIKSLDQARQDIRTGLSPMAQKAFDQVSAERFQGAYDVASRHVATEHGAALLAQDTDSIKLAQSDAGNAYADLDQSEKHVATIVSSVGAIADREGWTPQQRLTETLSAVSSARKDVGDRRALVDPNAGADYVKTFGQQMTSDDQEHVLQTARVEQARREADARRQQAEVHQQQREQAADLGEQARDLTGMIDNGVTVDSTSAAKLADDLDAHGKPILATELRAKLKVQDFNAQIKTWRPDQLQAWINDANGKTQEGASPEQGAQIEAANKMLGRMKEGLKSDPLSFAVFAGVAKLPPVDVSNPASVQQRVRTALGVAAKYNIPPVFMTDEEATALAGQVKHADANGKLQLATAIGQNFGRFGRDVLGSVSGNDPVFAHAAALATMGPAGRETARAIFTGQDLIAKGQVQIPSAETFQANTTMGDALRFAPATHGAVLSAARAIYASTAAGLDPKVLDQGLWTKALNRAAGATYAQDGSRVGGMGTFHHVNIVLPPTVRDGEFSGLMARVSDADLKANPPRYAGGKPVTAADLNSGYLFDAGAGKYTVAMDRAGTQFFRDGHGAPWVLDMGRMAPVLRARPAPTWFGRVRDTLGL